MAVRKGVLVAVVVLALVALALVVLAHRPAIAPVDPPAPASFPPQLVARGAQLAAAGDCNACHTPAGGRAYAGGIAVETPFGRIYSTNITPDPETGIGRWSQAAFNRAMREGVDREGEHLYPAFPYDFFRLASDDDLAALYAYLMTREPVRAEPPRNQLVFPLGFRPLVAGWKALYLDKGTFVADAGRSAEWNRGAYLANGLGHCGACHTPRNRLGATRKDRYLGGGAAEGWIAPALDASSPAPVPWNAERLHAYLKHGLVPMQGIPAGPMLSVAHNLETLNDRDVRAIATYVASVMGEPSPERRRRADELVARVQHDEAVTTAAVANAADEDGTRAGAEIYAGACAICHGSGRGASSANAVHLALTTTVSLPAPTNLIHVIEGGVTPRYGDRGRWMPAFRGAFTDEQLASLVTYLRRQYGPGEPWRDVEREIRRVRGERSP